MKKFTKVLVATVVLLGVFTGGVFANELLSWKGTSLSEQATGDREVIRQLFSSKNTTIGELRSAGIKLNEQIEKLQNEALVNADKLVKYEEEIKAKNKNIKELNEKIDKLQNDLTVAVEQGFKDKKTLDALYTQVSELNDELNLAYEEVRVNAEELRAIVNENK